MSKRLRLGMLYEIEVRGRSQDKEREAFREVIEQVKLGEALGYDSAWFVEHHFTRGFSHCSGSDLMRFEPGVGGGLPEGGAFDAMMGVFCADLRVTHRACADKHC